MIPESLLRKHRRYVSKKFAAGLSRIEMRRWAGVRRRMDDYERRESNAMCRRVDRKIRKFSKMRIRINRMLRSVLP